MTLQQIDGKRRLRPSATMIFTLAALLLPNLAAAQATTTTTTISTTSTTIACETPTHPAVEGPHTSFDPDGGPSGEKPESKIWFDRFVWRAVMMKSTCQDNTTDCSNAACPTAYPETGTQCSNSADDDADNVINDGCPVVGAAETGTSCTDSQDDDADGAINDGCPVVSCVAKEFQIFDFDPMMEKWNPSGLAVSGTYGGLTDKLDMRRYDTLFDPATTKLFIASHHFTDSRNDETTGDPLDVAGPCSTASCPIRLFRYSIAPNSTYSLDSGFPVTLNSDRKVETFVIAKDTTNKIWGTYQDGGAIKIGNTTGPCANTTNPAVDCAWTERDLVGSATAIFPSEPATKADDISSIIAFKEKVVGIEFDAVGLMWSNQASEKMYFSYHPDTAGNWTTREIAYSGTGAADDHMNLKTYNNVVYVAAKTSKANPGDPLVVLLVRRPGGTWENPTTNPSYVFGMVDGSTNHTRPIILLNTTLNTIHMFATRDNKDIVEKTAPMGAISFCDGTGTGAKVIPRQTNPTINFNNVTSTKQNVEAGSDLMVVATEHNPAKGQGNYWHYGECINQCGCQ